MRFTTLAFLLCSGCSIYIYNFNNQDNYIIAAAKPMVGMHERYDRTALREFLGVDPSRIDWCAAFVNSVLAESNIPGSESVHRYPLLARSFLNWGTAVDKDDIQVGDIVIFPRGLEGWQGHVGFFYDHYIDEDGTEYWLILGGNQQNSISIDPYLPNKAIGIRRWVQPE
jgi:uncharacterized protein (TIGR02594 family)